ncbi:Inner membrane protein YqjA [Candidatus Providencia siddallii]|uniref:Inner membrane protein YqjA n=1 Tax=Candidatus Providencia siddallii TaxID=1715285 RepID=A0A0M6W7E6_9GAMM|nr:Inner membrane protein YqjA [Candidatus Providencia siddallii]
MELFKELFITLWYQDYNILSNSSFIWSIYLILFIILFIENGVLPAAFLPGDSLLILVGVLINKNLLNYTLTIIILTSGASLGCWLGYIQGRLLSNSKNIKRWLLHLPERYHQRAYNLFYRHGLSSLLIGRFLPFIRTLLPIIAGFAGLKNKRFQLFNWLSGLLWVLSLINIGNFFCKSTIFQQYEHHIMNIMILAPIGLLIIGLLGSIVFIIKKYYKK